MKKNNNSECNHFSVTCQMSGMAGMSPADHALLDRAVKQIVHPLASPTPQMIAIATMQGAPPTTVQQVMQYLPEMQSLARQMGVKPPSVTGHAVPGALDAMIQQRALQWLQQRNMMTNGGGLFGMGNMGSMGNWLMRMSFFENFM